MTITTLTEFQFNTMDAMANVTGARVVSQLHPSENDSTPKFNEMTHQLEEMKALCELGLVREVSANYQIIREACRNQHGRELSLYELTSIGKMMFEDFKNRKAN